MSAEIVVLQGPCAVEGSVPDAERLVSGRPVLKVANYYADPGGRFFAGRWSATRGCWRVRYTEHELCVLLEGEVRLTGEGGVPRDFRAGDAFVVPAGFSGTWEVLADCSKLYAIFEPGTT